MISSLVAFVKKNIKMNDTHLSGKSEELVLDYRQLT